MYRLTYHLLYATVMYRTVSHGEKAFGYLETGWKDLPPGTLPRRPAPARNGAAP